MSNQEVIYSSLRVLQSPSESQNRSRPGATQRHGKTDDKEFSVHWHLIAVILGILCLLLLVTATVLGTKFLQCIREKHQQEEILRNLSQNCHNIQNAAYLKEQLLNKTLEYDILENETLQQKKKLDSLFIEKKRCHRKQESFSKSLQNTGKLYEDHWSCCGGKCYYFTTEQKDWKGCKQTCQSCSLSLLKIGDKYEQTFIQAQTHPDYYWIGLSYNEKESKWKWIDNDTSSGINLTIMSLPPGREECVFLTSTRIDNTDCSKTYNCICEKRIDCVSTACFK
ncbi:T-cell surface glycoprotein YE1/48-like [Diceros bicornis minor]|uniref:T-cell surface glycoprotein YE1/48-like n=1 Tax=Diceros bicornis minor TaxID=77932 RepID=UPI0026F297D4|nr:T-cell surface glycoprotein YE1/48-like [Diceros bicornis minor]XP_058414778.1 T-cell surface glycoprotein YE1/48-like [Diceros bicornis minor]